MLQVLLRRPALRRCLTTAASTTSSTSTRAIQLSDYKPFPYAIDSVHLSFNLGETTHVTSTLSVSPKTSFSDSLPLLELDGQELSTTSVELLLATGEETTLLTEGNGYSVSVSPDGDHVMKIKPPEKSHGFFQLKINTIIEPLKNTKLEGLYQSSGTFCTQCEAQGFRRITWFPDRPDVMSKFTVELIGEKKKCPILLSNGNLESSSSVDDDTHKAVWVDPFYKPAYLFALVAGDLVPLHGQYTTRSGRDVRLSIYTQAHNSDKTLFAMESLIESFQWDEDRFNLEYDLDLFNIVAVDDFNMGAMENKSLNVFNSRLVLASPETATDMDYERIQGVIGHEYFHNWTGNRVTVRDWFQLSLKEGLTVFRDQEFTSDLNSRPVKRIADVRLLRASQFPEDAGSMAHPIRPSSYEKIDNFYSVTVYEKGAEIVRMYHTLLGEERFQRGMELYFERHDGSAATTDDFYQAMADVTGGKERLGPSFQRWYSQAGTPTLRVEWEKGTSVGEWILRTEQETPMTPDGNVKEPVLIPLSVGMLDGDTGEELLLRRAEGAEGTTELVLRCDQERNEFRLYAQRRSSAVPTRVVVPSLLRGFSAPVRLSTPQLNRNHYLFILLHDTDSFNRSEAARNIMLEMIQDLVTDDAASVTTTTAEPEWWDGAVHALVSVLVDEHLDPAFRALCLEPPSTSELVDAAQRCTADPVSLHFARKRVLQTIAKKMNVELRETYAKCRRDSAASNGGAYRWTPVDVGRRSLAARCLSYLTCIDDEAALEKEGELTSTLTGMELASVQYEEATNMTDSFGALAAMNGCDGPQRDQAMSDFLHRWCDDPNVICKYLALESTTNIERNVDRVRKIFETSLGFKSGLEEEVKEVKEAKERAGQPVANSTADASVIAAARAFDVTTPNKVYALCRSFASSDVNFHASDGSGYRLLTDMILHVDRVNAQVGSRLASPFTKWLQLDAGRRLLIERELVRMVEDDGLSPNTREIVEKCLKQGEEMASGGISKL